MATTLEIKDLHVSIESKQILKGVNLKVSQGEIHAVMGPNGFVQHSYIGRDASQCCENRWH